MVCGMLWYVVVKVSGGEGVCVPQTQAIEYDSFFRLLVILPHISPHIKIRVTGAVPLSDFDFIEGVGLRMAGLASRIDGLLDWLVDLIE